MRRALILSILTLGACHQGPPPGPAQLECERVVQVNFGITRARPATVFEGTVAFQGVKKSIGGFKDHVWVRCVMDGSEVESVVLDGKLTPIP